MYSIKSYGAMTFTHSAVSFGAVSGGQNLQLFTTGPNVKNFLKKG
jgi:hypothetical protein